MKSRRVIKVTSPLDVNYQCQRLSALYFELYRCQGKCKGMEKGKGMMHQYRRGQGQQGGGNRMGNDSCTK